MISVVIVDDDPLVRRAVRDMLAPEADIDVVADVEDGARALPIVERLRPRIVLMDLQMPEMDGVETTLRLRGCAPDSRVLVLAIHRGDDDVRRALEAGALGFVLKGDPPEMLCGAIRLVAAGGAVLAPPTGRVLGDYAMPALTADVLARLETLTARERDVLAHIAAGRTNTETAGSLSISPETVKTHVTQILGKLDCNRVQAATLASRAGIATSPAGDPPHPHGR